MWTTEVFTELLAHVLEQVDVAVFQDQSCFIQKSASRSEFCSSRDPPAPRLSLALAMDLNMNARRFRMRASLSASKDTGMGVIDLGHICGPGAGLELDASSGQKVTSFHVCSVGDTRRCVIHR